MNDLGYSKNLFILPFDHRVLFKKEFKNAVFYKQMIYEAFKKSQDVVEGAAMLVDEENGDSILKDAKLREFTILLTTEKSGRDEFEFEYEDFATHIEKYQPTFAKALVRIKNGISDKTIENLKKLSDYCHEKGYKFLLEVLSERDPNLTLNAIDSLQKSGVEPDVWKLEGMEERKNYEEFVERARRNNRTNVGVVILGAGESKEKVEEWIRVGKNVPGIIGFAVGRTIFWQPLVEFRSGKIKREEAVEQISSNFIYFYKLFIGSIQ